IPITLSASTGERVKGEVSKFSSGVRRSTKFRIPLPLRAGERARGEVLLVPHSALRVPRWVCPDIVLPKYKTAIFVHGCFWHRHRSCKNCTTPTNRPAWWLAEPRATSHPRTTGSSGRL